MCWRFFDKLKTASSFESLAFANDRCMTTWLENWTTAAKGAKTQPRLTHFQLLLWRIIFLLCGIGGLAFLFIVTFDKESLSYDYIYLTNWTFTLETLYAGFALFIFLKRPGRGGASIPTVIKITWIMRNILIVLPFMISVIYWALLFPDNDDDHHVPKFPLACVLHGLNSILMLLEIYFTKVPILVIHVYMPLLYSLVYLTWSIIHYETKIGNPFGGRLIYPILDWTDHGIIKTTGLVFSLFIGVIILYLLIAYMKMDLQHLHRYKSSQSAGFLVNSIMNT